MKRMWIHTDLVAIITMALHLAEPIGIDPDQAYQYLIDLDTRGRSRQAQLRACWQFDAIMTHDAIRSIRDNIRTIPGVDGLRIRLRQICQSSPEFRALIQYAQSEPTRAQIQGYRSHEHSYVAIDCCQLWEIEITERMIRDSIRDPHLMREELLQDLSERWEELALPEYQMSNKKVVPLRWAIRTLGADGSPTIYLRADDLRDGLAVKHLPNFPEKKIALLVWRDQDYLSLGDALLAMSHGNKRSYPRFQKWVAQQVSRLFQLAESTELIAMVPPISAIYLIRIGSVAKLRDALAIPEQVSEERAIYQYDRTGDYRGCKETLDRSWRQGYGLAITTVVIYFVPADRLVSREGRGARHFARRGSILEHPEHPGLLLWSDSELLQEQGWLAKICRR